MSAGKWRKWILFCISIVRFSILINGSPKDFFGSSRGLRQGDPLSPLLFVIVMEALSRLLDGAVLAGHISGFTVGTRSNTPLMVTHLLFADDTLIFCDASASQVEYLQEILASFEAVSGLHINLAKSKLVPVGEVTNMGELVALLGCSMSSLPMTYLGLPLGAKFKDRAIWNSILERMEQRLTCWKRLYLSKGGKITLIKSTLSSLPTYFLSLFPIPVDIAIRIERLQRNFLWGGIDESPKFRLVKWAQVCSPLKSGSLGIRNLRAFNQASLGKWLWRYGRETTHLWRRVIETKFGNDWGGWCTKEVSNPYGVSLWRTIRQGWPVFSKSIQFEVGVGDRIKFWYHVWCGSCTLQEAFPELYNISCNKESSVADVMHFPNQRLH